MWVPILFGVRYTAPMKRDIPLQAGLFGDTHDILGLHVVAAHTRVLSDGSEVNVAEHVRWSRGQNTAPRSSKRHSSEATTARQSAEALPSQLSLWETTPTEDTVESDAAHQPAAERPPP